MKKRFPVLLLMLSVLFILLGQGVMVMGLAFSLLLIFKDKFRLKEKVLSKKKIFFVVLAFSLLFELGAIATGYHENEFGGGSLFHPDPAMDILISLFYWVPFSLFWTYLFSNFTYTRKSIFITGGVYGALTEQLFLVPMLLISGNPFVLIAAPYIFLLYGSAISAPYLVVEKMLPKHTPANKKQYLLPIFVLFPILFVVFAILKLATGGWEG